MQWMMLEGQTQTGVPERGGGGGERMRKGAGRREWGRRQARGSAGRGAKLRATEGRRVGRA